MAKACILMILFCGFFTETYRNNTDCYTAKINCAYHTNWCNI